MSTLLPRFLSACLLLLGLGSSCSTPTCPDQALSTERQHDAIEQPQMAPQLEQLRSLLGDFELTQIGIEEDGSSHATPRGPSQTRATLNGFLLETSLHCNVGGTTVTDALFQWSYDPFMKIYRVIITEGAFGYLDVYEGHFDENGCLLLSNEGMATPLSSEGSTFRARYRLEFDAPEMEGGYTIFGSFSINDGDDWADAVELRFDPAEPEL